MQKITVKTGFGYFKDQSDHVIGYAKLPPGDHPMLEGYTYHEVNSQAELDALEIYQDPQEVERAINEKKITDKVRANAIALLKAAGQLPGDYE